jgi:sugar phosphate isomerase/epimerase
MPLPIALQLYTLREAAAKDYTAVVNKVAEMGYAGVEPAGFPGTNAQAAGKLFKSLGLEVVGLHAPLPTPDKQNEILDTAGALGCKRIGCAYLPPERFKTVDGIKGVCEDLNAADAFAREHGLRFYYHNHWFEYGQVDGQPTQKIMLQHLAPTVELEIDTYWTQTGGANVLSVLKDVGARATLLHVKDGPADNKDSDMVALGDGVMDWHAIIPAAKHAEWLIVELDRCATDMMAAVAKSYKYLVGEGLARGNKN